MLFGKKKEEPKHLTPIDEKIEILGSGCKNCNDLEANTIEALTRLGYTAPVEHVKDFGQMAACGVMTTPALRVNEKVLLSGRVAKASEMEKLLKEALS